MEPPDAKAVAGGVSTMDDLVCVGRITPIFVRKIEYIGKEIRHMFEWNRLPHQRSRTVLPLGDCVVPMLYPSALTKAHVLLIRDIACSKVIGIFGPQILVNDNAILDIESAS